MSIILNKDQQKALVSINGWWLGSSMFMALSGRGGTGKSFLVDHAVSGLHKVVPIFLAPTHEALGQLRDKVKDNHKYVFKTVHSALGITPTTNSSDLEFIHSKLPSLWEEVNLAVIDESSMLPDWIVDILESIGVKILYVGHSSQLPPVTKSKAIDDPCVSPVFDRNYPLVELTIPQRHTGDIWDFNTHVEKMIYDSSLELPRTYNISSKELRNQRKKNREFFLEDQLKIAMWSNQGVDRYNQAIRVSIFGEKARSNKYLAGDKILLTSPLTVIENLESLTDKDMVSLAKKDDTVKLYSNSKATVLNCSTVLVRPCYSIKVLCNKIHVRAIDGEEYYFYEIQDIEDKRKLADYYEHLVWKLKTQPAKAKACRKRYAILSCFADVKHFYAATSHRLQGSNVPQVTVIYGDIMANRCIVERQKCLYVACSRVIDKLSIFKGV